MKHLLLSAMIATGLSALGVFHGLVTDRWAGPGARDGAGQTLSAMPAKIGAWQALELPRQEDDDPKTSIVTRRYTHGVTGNWVLTSITSGRAGRVSIHNPEHCYLGSGYTVVNSIHVETLTVGGEPARFWTGHFEKKKPAGVESIRIYWGWTSDGRWQAPAYPRLFFAGKPLLHKLYLIHPIGAGSGPGDNDLYTEFLVQYVAELSRLLGR